MHLTEHFYCLITTTAMVYNFLIPKISINLLILKINICNILAVFKLNFICILYRNSVETIILETFSCHITCSFWGAKLDQWLVNGVVWLLAQEIWFQIGVFPTQPCCSLGCDAMSITEVGGALEMCPALTCCDLPDVLK